MNYDQNNCIIFLKEEDITTFFKNKILETELESLNIKNSFTDYKNLFFKNITYALQSNINIYILKHLIISTGNVNELHILLLWKSELNYGIINDEIGKENFILRIEFRTIQKQNENLFLRLEWFEYVDNFYIDNFYIDFDKHELIDCSIKYIFNYAKYLKINNIKINNDAIITSGFIEKFIKNKNESTPQNLNKIIDVESDDTNDFIIIDEL
jgi:hypothetical protein